MRTLLIVFVVLGMSSSALSDQIITDIFTGVLSLLVAIIAFMMVRSYRRRERAQHQNTGNLTPSDAPNDRIGVTTHITAEPNDNPFLTASEKAIIDTASIDGASEKNVKNSSRFSDAVSSFVEKSRSLTYKISP
jgi:preprotein translocase subunit YajC